MNGNKTHKLILASIWLVVGMLLPLLTMQIKEVGDSLYPMHIAVMLCGFTCGWQYGLAVGFLLPFFRSAIFGMPPLFPNAVWMAFELSTYGFVIGFLFTRSKSKGLPTIYFSLIVSMILGRIVWGITKGILLGLSGTPFTIKAFIVGGILDGIPGIILQLILIPCFIKAYMKFGGKKNEKG